MKRLSVIIPVYNAEKTLSRCLESICGQTLRELEILIIDDGSSDGSLLIAKSFQEDDERIVILSQENQGVSSARNLGIAHVTSEYLTFADSDDFLEKNAYETVMKQIGDCDACFFGYKEYYEKEDHFRIISPEKTGIVYGKEAFFQCMLPMGYGYFTSVWNKVFRTERVRQRYFEKDLQIGEDELWLTQLLKEDVKVKLIADPLYNYVQSGQSLLHGNYLVSDKWLTALEAKKRVLSELNDDMLPYCWAKLYDDLFQLLWYSYVSDDQEKYEYLKTELSPYKNSFFRSSRSGILKKIRYMIILILIRIRAPKKLVQKAGEARTYRLKMFFNKG